MDSPSSSSSAFNVSFAYSSLLKDETVRETSEEDVNETDISSSVSSSSSSSLSSEVVVVSSPTAVAYFVLLLSLLSVGAVANVVVVVFARWPMRQNRVWLRLAIANLCVVQLFVCVLAAQASATTAVLGFFRRPVSADFCSAGCFLLHCGFAATAAGLVLLAVVRGRELERVCGGGEAAAAAEEATTGRRAMTAAIAVGPWLFGAAMASLALLDFHGSVASIVCNRAEFVEASSSSSSIGGAAWRIKPSITAVYAVLAALAVARLTVAYRCHSRRLDRLLASWRERSEQTVLLGRSSSQSNRTNQSKRKKRTKGRSKSGHAAVKLSSLAGAGERRPLNLTVDGQTNVLCPSQEDVDGAEEDYDDGGTEEDTFDMKMRLKFQKKPRSSERRHTVANIGLPDLSSQRRRSLENGKGKGASSPASDYQYVRKWSVDITALANQLENPKLHTSSYPTLRNTSPGSGSTYGEPGKEEDEEEEQAGTTAGDAGGGGGVAARGSSSVLLLPGITTFTGRLSTTTVTTTKEAYANLDTPSIVVSLTPDTEADTLDYDDGDGSSFDAGSRPDSELSVENRRRRPSLALLTLETVGRTPDDKGVIAAREELSEVVRTTVATLVSLVLVLPLTISDLLEPVTRATFGTNFDVNLRMMATALGLVQGVTVPLLLVWSTKDIREQLATIRDLLQTLRCVCYCHLGSGRSCSIRKRHSKKRQPTV